MEEVRHELGGGLRTLQRSFLEYFQISPSRYLRLLRHDRAHRELLARHPATHRVAEIAMRHGFTHLSRFAGSGTTSATITNMPCGGHVMMR